MVAHSILLCALSAFFGLSTARAQHTMHLRRGVFDDVPTTPPSRDIGKLPALGWNTWTGLRCDYNESHILEAANQFIALGLDKAGYKYINVDDCYALRERDPATGRMVPDPAKFPNGIKNVSDQVHALGLKFGIYSDAGTQTCAGFPGSLEREELDAKTFAEWGVDYLKYDNCNVPQNWSDSGGDWYDSKTGIRYRRMTDALVKTGRPIEFAMCTWGYGNPWDWGARAAHSWRIFGDSRPSWGFTKDTYNVALKHLDAVDFYAHNDMDSLEIGNGNWSIEEQRTQFAIWAAMKSPIQLGTDLSKLTREQLDIVTNKEILAFHQDETFGGPATPFAPNASTKISDPPQFLSGRSVNGYSVFMINTNTVEMDMVVEIDYIPEMRAEEGPYYIYDMWTGRGYSGFGPTFSTRVQAHDTAAFRLIPISEVQLKNEGHGGDKDGDSGGARRSQLASRIMVLLPMLMAVWIPWW